MSGKLREIARLLWPYALALLGVVAVTLARMPFEATLQGRVPYMLYLVVILVTAWFYGVGPTVFATGLSLLAAWYYILPPAGSFALGDPGYRPTLVMFLLVSSAMVWLARVAGRTRRAAVQALETSRRAQRAAGAASWDWQAVREVVHPDDRERLSAAVERALGEGGSFNVEFRTRLPDPARPAAPPLERWLAAAGDVVSDERGQPRIEGLTIDITERKQAEESRARLAAIVESSDDAIVGKNLNGVVLTWNAGAARLFGYSAEEIVGRSITLLIPEERQAEEDQILARLRRGERIDHFETVRRRKDGALLDVTLSVSPIRDARGVIVGAAKVARDVTERKRAERAIAEQRERFRVTLSSIGDAVITTDREARVTFLNSVAETLTGWRAAEAVGRPLAEVFQIVNEDSRERVDNPAERVLRTGAVVGLANHTALVTRDGTDRPIADSAAPIVDDDGQVQGVVLVFRDVSEQRQAELLRRAVERDREQLLQSERAARSEAERATRLKDEFVAVLSHELRTPLTAILGWTQVLRRAKPGDPAALARGLEVIERNTRLQSQLISDLLDVSGIASGKLRLELELVDLAAVIEAAVETVRGAADARSVAIARELEPNLPALVGDRARLQQIVWNLLSNAIKFTPEGGRVTVKLVRQDVAAVMTVSDNGVGIKPDFIPHLFDRFRQADSSTTRRFGGLGLGLAIVKQLTELHNGVVSAESPGEGQGATFTVRLPLGVLPAEGKAGLAAPAGSAGRGLELQIDRTRLANVQVLLVEDEADTRELVERLLTESGARVVAAASAAAAREAFARQRPDVFVSDIGLPGEDGYSLIARIRALEPSGEAPVPAIALTAFARSEDRTRALEAGFQAHLAKPIEPTELLATVASLAQMTRRPG